MIFKANAFETLPGYFDKSFDLVLTDPPYDLTTEQQKFLIDQSLRIAKGLIVFCPPENQFNNPDQYLFWIKPTSTKNTSKAYSRFVEMICIFGQPKYITGRHWSQYINIFRDLVDNRQHPYRKPPSLIERLILNHTEEGDHIIDPFCGSGVVHEVGTRLGRCVTAFDIAYGDVA